MYYRRSPMNRRTLIRRVGASGLATTALVGSATAARTGVSTASGNGYEVGRELDVSDVSGTVTLAELLEPGDLDGVPAHIDPRTHEITVAEGAGSITLDDCCVYCCAGGQENVCEDKCSCCDCDFSC